MNDRYHVVRISAAGEQRVGHERIALEDAQSKRDRLNEDLAHIGVKYCECRYAIRISADQEMRAAA